MGLMEHMLHWIGWQQNQCAGETIISQGGIMVSKHLRWRRQVSTSPCRYQISAAF
ncbi:hypothetical protein YSA_07402 [Pseudomonas putida ND6]|uniref:Uncharacterized protein n=1 Tax=Pseudomonas putida ND6 TaxID=231023 RepID=I3UZ44_PSEPU|nr:hypothetical protein YSA_07402 [Pseudomonas putida ND6]